MAGFGIQKRGTSKILIARKKFSEGGDVDSDYLYKGETEDGTKIVYGQKAPKELIETLEKEQPIKKEKEMKKLTPEKNIKESKIPLLPSDFDIKKVGESLEEYKKKESKEEPKLQFRCAGPNPTKKCGHRDEKKKGGRPGLWANINARKKAGTSRSKSESTISSKAYANMKAGFPKKGKK